MLRETRSESITAASEVQREMDFLYQVTSALESNLSTLTKNLSPILMVECGAEPLAVKEERGCNSPLGSQIRTIHNRLLSINHDINTLLNISAL